MAYAQLRDGTSQRSQSDRGASSNMGNRHEPPRYHSNTHGPNGGDPEHGGDRWQEESESGYRRNGQHRGIGHDGGGRPPMRQPPWSRVDVGHAYIESRSRGQSRSKSRPPEKHPYEGADSQYHTHDYRDVQGYQQQYRSEDRLHNGLSAQAHDIYVHGDPSHGYGDGWELNQHSNDPIDTNQEHKEYTEPQRNAGHQLQRYEDGYGKGPQDNNVYSKFQDHEPTRVFQGQPASISSQSESSQPSKTSNKRLVEITRSPDTVAWDNPFPTFPMRPKRSANSSYKSLDGPMAEVDSKGQPQHVNDQHSRPQTASSNSSSYTIPQPHSIDDSVSNSPHYHDGHFNRGGRMPGEADRDASQEALGTRRNGNTVDQLRPSPIQGRRSDDRHRRPPLSANSPHNSSYERSKTMPAAISEVAVRPIDRPRLPIQTVWQEPGPVAGYHGPEDGGFTPISPGGASQRRPNGHPRLDIDDTPPYVHATISNAASQYRNQNQDAQTLHTPQDSLGDVFDNYYDTPSSHEHQPFVTAGPGKSRPHLTDDMPEFGDAALDSERSHNGQPNFDQHSQPRQQRHGYSPALNVAEVNHLQNQQGNTHAKWQVPRSRSQPNFRDRRSPKQQQDGAFDFGVPGPAAKPPATAPAQPEYVPKAHGSTRLADLDLNDVANEQQPRRQGQGPALPASHYNGDRNIPPPFAGPVPVPYRVGEGPGRYHSPPQNVGTFGPPPTAHRDNAQPDRYRSPPLQGGHLQPGPSRPPGGSTPYDRNTRIGAHPNLHQAPRQLPQLHNGGSRDGHVMPANGKLPATSSTGVPRPSVKPPVNPDALPSHPAPVRTRLMHGSPVTQSQKPAPVRQYDAVPSSMPLSEPLQKPQSSHSSESKPEPVLVTHQELDKLKQMAARNPNDLAAQLVLAKKMVEAASVLVDERADSRTRSKSREKYIMDAHKIVKKLSSGGFPAATFYLADCYTRGALGLEADTREAFKLYQSAAKAGHAQAAYRVAVCCEIGQEEGGGTSRDAVKAMQWYKRAATLGDTPAMYKMGIISLKGLLGQPRNPQEAIVWLKKAAERADKENPHALHELALLHEKPNSNDGVTQNEAYSNQLFTQAAHLGYKFSQYRLGSAYEYGLMGCHVDPRQSIAWYSKAAVQEEHQSELALSGWYLTGSEGILQQSDTEAYLWARKAALAGLAKAEYAMGYFTEVGIGAAANLEDAKRWYWKAASQNFPKARDRLEDLRKGGPTKRKERVSRSNIRKSTEGDCIVM